MGTRIVFPPPTKILYLVQEIEGEKEKKESLPAPSKKLLWEASPQKDTKVPMHTFRVQFPYRKPC